MGPNPICACCGTPVDVNSEGATRIEVELLEDWATGENPGPREYYMHPECANTFLTGLSPPLFTANSD